MIFTDKIRDVILNPVIRDVRNQASFYPSSASCEVTDPVTGLPKVIGGPDGCLRSQYYSITGHVPTNDSSAENRLKAELGGHIQEIIEDKLKQAGLWIASERRIRIPHIGLNGRLDTWCWDPRMLEQGRRVPVAIEFKSVSAYQESGITRPTKGSLMPKDDHVAQVLPYLDFFSQWPDTFGGEPCRIVIFTIGRESMAWAEHVVILGGRGRYGDPLDKDDRYAIVRNETGTFQLKYLTLRGVYNRWAKLRGFLKRKEIPPRDFELEYSNDKLALLAEKEVLSKTKRAKIVSARKKDPDGKGRWLPGEGDWQCAYCSFRDLCWTGISHQQPPVIRQEHPEAAEARKPPVVEPTGTI